MKLLALTIVMVFSAVDIGRIAQVNKIKSAAEQAFKNGDYDTAIKSYRLLTDSLSVDEDPVLLNLANAYFLRSDTTNAAQYYSRLLASNEKPIRSQAYQQMGIINQQRNKMDLALSNFKEAIKSDPTNEDARYNYELLKRILDEQEQQEQQDDEKIEPSENAKRLKAQADKLVRQNLFEQALGIMQQGLQEDETVAAYNSFISKLNDVVQSRQ